MTWEDDFARNLRQIMGATPIDEFKQNLDELLSNYNPNQPRDKDGKWTSGGFAGGGAGKNKTYDISGYPQDAKEITEQMAMAQAEYSDIQAQMNNNLSEITTRKHESMKVAVSGKIDSDSAGQIVQNMKHELADYGGYLAGDTMGRARDYVESFESSIKKGIEDGSLEGISAKDLDGLAQDNIKKLMYQEVESNRQQFTDHGIRHISGNVLRQKQILRAMQEGVTGKEELMGDFIMINHDVGYTTPLVREGGFRGVMMSGQHPKFSEKIAGQQKSIWNEGKIFSSKEYDKMLGIIRTHDSTVIDTKDWLASSTRLSDNLSLFNGEKLPSMFKYVPNGDKHLIGMGLAAAKKNNTSFEKQRKLLYNQIDKANFSTQLKRDLKSATKEISYMSPKFTMGVLAGNISSIARTPSNKLNVKVAYNKYDSFLQKYFDMGQKQTKKLLNDYGITDFSKTKYDIGGVVELEIIK